MTRLSHGELLIVCLILKKSTKHASRDVAAYGVCSRYKDSLPRYFQ